MKSGNWELQTIHENHASMADTEVDAQDACMQQLEKTVLNIELYIEEINVIFYSMSDLPCKLES